MRTCIVLCALAATAPALAAPAADEKPQCKLMRIDEWKVEPGVPVPFLKGFVNGRSVPILLDTGMSAREGALLERVVAMRLGVPLGDHPATFVGVGGESRAQVGIIDEIRIGEAKRRNWSVLVAGEDHGHRGVFIIGNEFFQDIDLEFDLAEDAVRIFKNAGCRGVSLAYWAKGRASEAPIWLDGHIKLDVRVNGKPVRAMLDSGASTTILDLSLARRLGVTRDSPGTLPGRCMIGIGKDRVESWSGQFESFAIGDETIRNPRMYFADLRIAKYELPEMILGADFLRSHRVLIARGHRKIFFTYGGGTVFPTAPSASCKT
jgi:predicted aspartyl protease